MIHFGLKRLNYIIKFDISCYYPITFEKKNNRILLKVIYGLFGQNFIGVSWRPSDRLEQIDLFCETSRGSIETTSFIGTIQTNRPYAIKIKRETIYNLCWVRVFDTETGNVVLSFSTHYKFPIVKAGYIVERKRKHKIILKRN